MSGLVSDRAALIPVVRTAGGPAPEIVGVSAWAADIQAKVLAVAACPSNVLLTTAALGLGLSWWARRRSKAWPMRSLLVALMVAVSVTPARATVITIHSGSMFIRAYDGVVGAAENTLPASLPLDTVRSATDGIAANATHYAFDHGGFLIDVEHVRAKVGNANTQSISIHPSPIKFSVDVDSPYALSVFYNLSGPDRIVFYAQLTDATAGNAVLFRNQQVSYSTPNESFTLGEVAGDTTYPIEQFLSGSLTGNLLAGHHYKLEYNFTIGHWGSINAANANGQLRLQIGEIVPEPSSLLLMLAGVAGLLLWAAKSNGAKGTG